MADVRISLDNLKSYNEALQQKFNSINTLGTLVFFNPNYDRPFSNINLREPEYDGDTLLGNSFFSGSGVAIEEFDFSEATYLYIIDFRYNAQNYTQSIVYSPYKKVGSNTVLTAAGDGLLLKRLGESSGKGARTIYLCCPSETTITLGNVTKIKLA